MERFLYQMKVVEGYLLRNILLFAFSSTFIFSVFSQSNKKIDSISYYLQLISNEQNLPEKAQLHLDLSKYLKHQNKEGEAVDQCLKSLKIYEKLNLEEKIADCQLLIFYHSPDKKRNKTAKKFLDRYYEYAQQHNDTTRLALAYKGYAIYNWSSATYKTAKKYFHKAIKYSILAKDSLTWAKTNGNLGLLYSGFEQNQDSARYFFNRELKYYENKGFPEHQTATYINMANSYEKEIKIQEALYYLIKADSIPIKANKAFYKKIIYRKFANYYKYLKDYKKALTYKEKFILFKDSINNIQKNIAISEIQTKYETEKKEKENAILKNDIAKKKQTQTILWVVVLLSIIIGTGISILIAKNAKRKQLVAKQKEKIRIQEIEKELKEQELNSIDVLIEGQEKERQRLAENLHDNLGGTLAALKLNLQNLQQNKHNNSILEKSINNSLSLIDDAYQNVRNMAYEKSNGVVASQGLLPAIQKFTSNISAEKLKINVEHYGLQNRLDNSLEIRIFRIIQELIANIIKHAKATEATISLTNHNSTLNIIVEDNGKGFTKNSKFSGVGIATIEKRIENLGGTLEIDSYPNKGSSIIINLPL